MLGAKNAEKMKRRNRKTSLFSLMDELMASATEPMPKAKQQYQLTRMYQGLHALEAEPNPKMDDWRAVTDAINLMESMVRDMKICEDNSGLLNDATKALKEAAIRYKAGQALRLNAAGIHAVRAVLEDYAAMLAILPHRAVVNCYRITEKRILEINSGKMQAHDVILRNQPI
jgi:uncharacterized protein YyaL (SSP411 family)